MLDLSGSHGYWQCATIPGLRLRQRRESGLPSGQRHRLVLAGIEQEFLADPAGTGGDDSLPQAIALLGLTMTRLLVRWSLTALIRELEEQLAGLQDVAGQASRRRSPRALTATQQQLLRTGIDSRIAVNDIVRYADDPWWKHDVLDFTEVVPPGTRRESRTYPFACRLPAAGSDHRRPASLPARDGPAGNPEQQRPARLRERKHHARAEGYVAHRGRRDRHHRGRGRGRHSPEEFRRVRQYARRARYEFPCACSLTPQPNPCPLTCSSSKVPEQQTWAPDYVSGSGSPWSSVSCPSDVARQRTPAASRKVTQICREPSAKSVPRPTSS